MRRKNDSKVYEVGKVIIGGRIGLIYMSARTAWIQKEDFAVRKILCAGEGTSKQKAIKEIFNTMAYPLYGMTQTDTMVNLMVNLWK